MEINTYSQGLYLSIFGMSQRTYMNNKYENQHSKNASMNVNNGERYIDKPSTYANGVGFILKHELSKRLLFCYGLSYFNHGQKYSIARDSMNSFIEKGRIRLSYIGLPLLFQYNFINKEKYFLYLSGGPQISALLYERGGVPVYGKDFISFNLVDAGSLYKNFNIEGIASLGMEYRMSQKIAVFLEGKFRYSFNDVENKSAEEFDYDKIYKIFEHEGLDRSATHNIAIGLAVGLSLTIR